MMNKIIWMIRMMILTSSKVTTKMIVVKNMMWITMIMLIEAII